MQVMASLILGVVFGLFFGEIMGKINIVGEVYIQLLQMTVIPYILVSLVSSLGSLDMSVAKKIGIKGGHGNRRQTQLAKTLSNSRAESLSQCRIDVSIG